MASNVTGIKRIINATGYSYLGLKAAWKHEAAFRQELVMTILAIIVASVLDIGMLERVLLIFSVALVMVIEILNSAIEAVVDRIGTEHHELSGRAKDMGSAAVLVTIIIAIAVWAMILCNAFII